MTLYRCCFLYFVCRKFKIVLLLLNALVIVEFLVKKWYNISSLIAERRRSYDHHRYFALKPVGYGADTNLRNSGNDLSSEVNSWIFRRVVAYPMGGSNNLCSRHFVPSTRVKKTEKIFFSVFLSKHIYKVRKNINKKIYKYFNNIMSII